MKLPEDVTPWEAWKALDEHSRQFLRKSRRKLAKEKVGALLEVLYWDAYTEYLDAMDYEYLESKGST